MKDLYKRLYTQKEIESYDINKLQNLLTDGKNYPFERHATLNCFVSGFIFTSILWMFLLYNYENSSISIYSDMNIMQKIFHTTSDFISEGMRRGIEELILAVLLIILWHNAILTIPLWIWVYFRDRKLAKYRTPLYHKNVELLQHELDIKKDIEAKYQERLTQAQKELIDKTDVIKKEIQVKYDVQF